MLVMYKHDKDCTLTSFAQFSHLYYQCTQCNDNLLQNTAFMKTLPVTHNRILMELNTLQKIAKIIMRMQRGAIFQNF